MWSIDLTVLSSLHQMKGGANQTVTVLLESSIRTKSKTVYQPTQGTCCTWAKTSSFLCCRCAMILDIYSTEQNEYYINVPWLRQQQAIVGHGTNRSSHAVAQMHSRGSPSLEIAFQDQVTHVNQVQYYRSSSCKLGSLHRTPYHNPVSPPSRLLPALTKVFT